MKKTLVFVLVFAILSITVSAEVPVPENAEVIEFDVESAELIELKKCKFEKVDLRPYANRAFVDEVAGDMTGGWSDQGPDNDMRNFDLFGNVEILGIPFHVIPAGENGGKSVLGVRGKNNMELPRRVEIPYNKHTAGVYFLQSAPYAFSAGHWVGRYSFEYTDGAVAYTDVISSYQISDFFGSSVPLYGKRAWLGDNKFASDNGYRINLSMFALKNPHPEKTVKNLVIETEGSDSFIMIVGLTFVDKGPYYLQDGDIALNPKTDGWKTAEKKDIYAAAGSAIDVSYLLDAPAGKHGFIKTQGEGFIFEDGTPARFWGTNLYGKACFPDKTEAEELAWKLAQNGFNIVRMTNLDGDFEGNIFEGYENTAEISPESADKLCYLIKCLKDRGIYTYITITSKRPVKNGDNIEKAYDITDGYKIEGLFDDGLIKLQQDYLKKLLSYENKYIGCKIGNDPAVAIIEYADSNSMFSLSTNPNETYGISSVFYKDELNERFNYYLRTEYRSDSSLKAAWKDDYGFTEGCSLKKKNVAFSAAWKNSPIIGLKHKTDIARFFGEIHRQYYEKMERAARECGFKGVTTSHSSASNTLEYGDVFSGVGSDFIAVNAYSSVNMGMGKSTDPSVYGSGLGIMESLVKSRVSGAPFFVSGYNTGFGAKFSGDTVLAMAALSAQQGWSACQYYFNGGNENKNDIFEVESDISRLGLMPAAAVLNSGMKELDEGYVAELPVSALVSPEFNKTVLPHIFDKKVSVSLKENNNVMLGVDDNKRKYINDNFMFDSGKHIYKIKTANTEACIGVLSEKEEFDYIDYHLNSAICAAALSALDGKDFKTADRLLLTTVGRTRNEGMQVDEWFNIEGGGDSVTEPVTGMVVFKNLGNIKVYALDFSGRKTHEMAQVKDKKGNIIVPITEDNSAVYYEIVREG